MKKKLHFIPYELQPAAAIPAGWPEEGNRRLQSYDAFYSTTGWLYGGLLTLKNAMAEEKKLRLRNTAYSSQLPLATSYRK